MIQLLENHADKALRDFLLEDIALNYFLLLAMDSGKDYFSEIFVEKDEEALKGALFIRKSGTVQCYLPFLNEGSTALWGAFFTEVLCHQVILPKIYYEALGLETIFPEAIEKAYIANLTEGSLNLKENHELNLEKLKQLGYSFEKHEASDALDIEGLYKQVFETYSSHQTIERRLIQRGRGVKVLFQSQLVSSVCSEYETEQNALIVGVATLKEHCGKGLATTLLYGICKELLNENKTLWLQYDNPKAGNIYKSLGFVEQYAIVHAQKTNNVIQPQT